jgi:hypothetical protein
MSLQKFNIKNNRHVALEISEVIALDFNASMKEIRIHLRGGSVLSVEGKKAAKIWKQFAQNLPELLSPELLSEEFDELIHDDPS